MSDGTFRNMRLFVMFDIPIDTDKGKRAYSKFHRFLVNNGFDMLQYSIYTRFCHNDSDCKKHEKRLKANTPKCGSIRLLKVTENQYENMVILAGEATTQEQMSIEDLIVIE